jgi:hypothetical protein
MTSISLHPTPSSRTVATEQFRAVGLALRTEALFFVGALILLGIIIVGSMMRQLEINPSMHMHVGFSWGLPGAIPIFLVALLVPFSVWRAEDPSRRAYHWSMPVARGPHTIFKLLSGWLWMMIATVVYLIFVVILATLISIITKDPITLGSAPAWEWVVAFTAPTLAYLLTSIAVIGSDHAWRWIGGLLISYWVLVGVLGSFGMSELSVALRSISDGAYGLNAALFGSVRNASNAIVIGVARNPASHVSMSNWLVAMPLWIIGAGIAVTIASYRHRD